MDRATSSGNRAAILGALLLATFLTAMEATVVSTAMPTIIGELRGLTLYAWVFSAYLLTSTATVPLYGRLADMLGRKPVFLAGVGLFLLGSALSGMAQSMPQLIAFRALQGLGAGAVQPIVFTILGDLYTLEERARVQGLFSGVWGASSVAGPALGALLTETIGWRWIFYINLPFGLAAALLVRWALHERPPGRRHRLDYAGAATLTAGVALLLWGLLGGQRGGVSPPALVAGVALLVAFVAIEARAPEPVLPLDLFREPFVAVPCLAGLVIGTVQFAVPSYVPLFVQGVQLGTAGDAAKVLVPVSISWTLAAFVSPRLLLRYGFRPVAVLGTGLIGIGTAALLLYTAATPRWAMAVNLAAVGLGLGFSSNSLLLAAQNAVGWERRGVVTASVQFTRTIGGTIGIALLGAVLNARLAGTLRAAGAADVNALLNPDGRGALPPDTLELIRRTLASGLHQIYLLLAVAGAIGLAVAFFLPSRPAEAGPASPARATSGQAAEGDG